MGNVVQMYATARINYLPEEITECLSKVWRSHMQCLLLLEKCWKKWVLIFNQPLPPWLFWDVFSALILSPGQLRRMDSGSLYHITREITTTILGACTTNSVTLKLQCHWPASCLALYIVDIITSTRIYWMFSNWTQQYMKLKSIGVKLLTYLNKVVYRGIGVWGHYGCSMP